MARNCFQGGPGPTARKQSGQRCFFFSFFSPQLTLQLTEWVQWFYYRENYTFSKDPGGVQHFSGGSNFSRGEGVLMLISIETHIICNFPGPGPISPPPLDLHMFLITEANAMNPDQTAPKGAV